MHKLRVTNLSAAARAVRSTWVTYWHRTYLDGSSDKFRELLPDMSIVHDGVSLNHVGHLATPYPSLGSGLSRPTDLGDPLA